LVGTQYCYIIGRFQGSSKLYEEQTEFLINFERSGRALRVPFPELQVLSLDRPLVGTIILLQDFVDPLRCPKNRENSLFPLHGVELASRVPFPELQVLSLDRPLVGTIRLLEDLRDLLRCPKNRQNSLFPLYGVEEVLASRVPFPKLRQFIFLWKFCW
jgi:hypothetical protein